MPAPKTATSKRSGKTKNETPITGMRIPAKQLAEIDRRAKRHKLTRTDYMIRTALGEPLDPRTLEQRVAELEQRVGQTERHGTRNVESPANRAPAIPTRQNA